MTRIAVLTIGTELLDGRVSDSNTADIARALQQSGLQLAESRCVADIPDMIADQLREMSCSCAVLLVTGGLGPTDDDLTAAAAANAFDLPLHENHTALSLIEDFFHRTARPMHTANRKQALLPAGALPIPNPSGSAPGFLLAQQQCRIYFLPGVPREMQVMLQESVLPQLTALFPAPPRKRKTFKVLGIAESHLQEKLRPLTFPEGLDPTFTLDYPLVLLGFEASGQQADTLLERCAEMVRPLLDTALVAEDAQTLPGVVAELLQQHSLTLSLAESCTGGLVASLLTDIPGTSRFLERGAVTYANSAKQDWLGVPETDLEQHGAVSEEVARAMATGIRKAAGTDLALGITGIAGPDGGTPEKPVGTVFVALATAEQCLVEPLKLQGDRAHIRRAAAFRSLDLLRRHLTQQL